MAIKHSIRNSLLLIAFLYRAHKHQLSDFFNTYSPHVVTYHPILPGTAGIGSAPFQKPTRNRPRNPRFLNMLLGLSPLSKMTWFWKDSGSTRLSSRIGDDTIGVCLSTSSLAPLAHCKDCPVSEQC